MQPPVNGERHYLRENDLVRGGRETLYFCLDTILRRCKHNHHRARDRDGSFREGYARESSGPGGQVEVVKLREHCLREPSYGDVGGGLT
jgi:hypothetical protein